MELKYDDYVIEIMDLSNSSINKIYIYDEYEEIRIKLYQAMNYYFNRDYYNLTLKVFSIVGKIREGDGMYLIDNQNKRSYEPDFEYRGDVIDNNKDFFIEFKSEDDNLSMNQLKSLITLSNLCKVYILHIRRMYGKRG